MTTQSSKLREDVNFRILRLLQDNPERSQRELAKAVGLSTGGIHYVLNALLDKGLLKIENSTTTEDKRRYAYILTREGMASKANLTKRFLIRKMADYELLMAEIYEVIVEVCEDQSDTEMAELKTLLKDC
jgi:EPS-associated MarR family transcriptional regulator